MVCQRGLEDLAMLWIDNLGLWKSGEAGPAASRVSVGSTEPDVCAFWALIKDASSYWNLLQMRVMPKHATAF
jgi:hypothetical protein